jgi:hypothetical protein
VLDSFLGVKSGMLAGEALVDDAGVFIDKYAHSWFVLVTFTG